MIDNSNIQLLNAKGLNLSKHYSLFEGSDLYYLLNGDIQGNESSNNDWFIQNQLSNESCVEFGQDYTLVGSIKLNNYEHALFFVVGQEEDSEIGIFDSLNCVYTTAVKDPCLGFRLDKNIRGVYKFNNSENDRRIYFIDGYNNNRYLDIDKAVLGDYPKTYTGSKCNGCDIVYGESLDCESLQINKCFSIPCVSVEQTNQGQLLSGVYQIGIAYGEDGLALTDYYFSQPIKVFSETSNIGFQIDLNCFDSPFNQYSLILVGQTRENSLVVYNMGFYPLSTTSLTITNTDNATILDTSSVLIKRVLYDYSEHIATNDETLLIGKHRSEELLMYQTLANSIVAKWQEIKVPKKHAHLYPSLLRDEVYSFAIEWFDKKGKSLGRFHIPGRESILDDLSTPPTANDIYETINCNTPSLVKWQIENTATLLNNYGTLCEDCSGDIVSKDGLMAYWESENLTYPNTEEFGNLACQKIRHHKMPSHDLTHIHDDFTTGTAPSGNCETYTIYYQDGTSYEETYCPPDSYEVQESDCVNILAVKFENIAHPLSQALTPRQDIGGYRILVGDRNGNKSILHKGLIYNLWKDTSTEVADSKKVEILYPNYPFNDLNPDVFLTTSQVANDTSGSTINDQNLVGGVYSKSKFTYHSPDIHYKETRQEFGTEMKLYGEEIGWIEGKFSNVYKHPQTRLGIGNITADGYRNNACQLDSVCHYSKFVSWATPFRSRFEIQASQYLLPINQLTSDNKRVNNYLRESSYYLSVGRDVADPASIDVSRVLASEVGYSGSQDILPSFSYFNQVKRKGTNKNIQGSSYYVGIKIKNPDQYGSLEQINYRPTSCVHYAASGIVPTGITYESDTAFAGDVYISKHTLVRKMPLFTQWLSDVPIDTELDYREYRNLWYPRYWYDNLTEADDQYNLDGFADIKGGSDILAAGKFYIFVSGVIDFWCESEFIGDFRERDYTINGQFYPKVNYEELTRSDIIPYDNKFLYNLSLLNTNIERYNQDTSRTESDADFTVIYSKKNDFQAQGDPWLQFLPLNYTILPRIYGKFTAMHPTDMYSMMFGFEDGILYSQSNNFTVNINEGSTLLLGQGDVFTNRLIKISNEQTGYCGVQDPMSFVNTRFGTFFIDRKRKKVFKWSGQLEDITGDMNPWFQRYLKDNSGIDYYNSLIAVFDNYTENIYFTEKTARNRWTISYKPKRQAFISFHSFTPDYYLVAPNTYFSYYKTKSPDIWKHNSKFNYQTYYGEQAVFDIGIVINNKFSTSEFQNIEIFSEWIKYQDFGEEIYTRLFFDKILAYNNRGNTGIRDVLLKDRENPYQSTIQNKETSLVTEVTQIDESIYRFNKLESLLNDVNSPIILWDETGYTYSVPNIDTYKNPRVRNDIKGKWLKLHLISTNNTDNKILVQLLVPNTDKINV